MNAHAGLPQRILLADDDSVFCEAAATALSAAGFAVSVVSDGAEAISVLGSTDFDLAIVDLAMPRVDGFRLIALIRSTSSLIKLPIIVVTSSDKSEDAEEAHRLGANMFLIKPINWRLFPDIVRNVLDAKRSLADTEHDCRQPPKSWPGHSATSRLN
ncbi:MAG: response regulator [Hyphomicrobium sp.]